MGRKVRPQPDRLAIKLKQIRESLELSQPQMAAQLTTEKSPVHNAHISHFEKGTRQPSYITLLKYARLAKVNAEVLIDDEVDLPKHLLHRK
ncbi:MAG TPA: helix-turn-helix transcriptional regulator [Blastocatellia bacterium]|nr:helix-turn-helix transcriptional regulator [Blastocatellia bacterium]